MLDAASSSMSAHTHTHTVYIYIYIDTYIYAVKLKVVQCLPFLKLKSGPLFLFFCFFCVFENLVLPAERRGFLKKQAKKNNKKHNF